LNARGAKFNPNQIERKAQHKDAHFMPDQIFHTKSMPISLRTFFNTVLPHSSHLLSQITAQNSNTPIDDLSNHIQARMKLAVESVNEASRRATCVHLIAVHLCVKDELFTADDYIDLDILDSRSAKTDGSDFKRLTANNLLNGKGFFAECMTICADIEYCRRIKLVKEIRYREFKRHMLSRGVAGRDIEGPLTVIRYVIVKVYYTICVFIVLGINPY
jgi:hypothetical protein